MAKKKSTVNEGYNFVFDDAYIKDVKKYFSDTTIEVDQRVTSYLEIMEQITGCFCGASGKNKVCGF